MEDAWVDGGVGRWLERSKGTTREDRERLLTSLPFPSLPFPSLPFPSLPFPSHPIPPPPPEEEKSVFIFCIFFDFFWSMYSFVVF